VLLAAGADPARDAGPPVLASPGRELHPLSSRPRCGIDRVALTGAAQAVDRQVIGWSHTARLHALRARLPDPGRIRSAIRHDQGPSVSRSGRPNAAELPAPAGGLSDWWFEIKHSYVEDQDSKASLGEPQGSQPANRWEDHRQIVSGDVAAASRLRCGHRRGRSESAQGIAGVGVGRDIGGEVNFGVWGPPLGPRTPRFGDPPGFAGPRRVRKARVPFPAAG
jgi:hypothetical protein